MQTMAEHTRALLGTGHARPRRRRMRWDRQGILLAVLLGHGALLGWLAHVAGQHLARDWQPSTIHPTPPLASTLRLVVQLLPLASGAAPRATEREPSTRSAAAPRVVPLPAAPRADAAVADVSPNAPVATAPVEPPAVPGVHLDNPTLRRALQDADAGTVRGLAKRAGRLDDVERLRADPLAAAMASAAASTLREGAQARVADDAKCKQELGKSGVGEKNRDNDRDTFMTAYIGAGKDCKK